MTRKRVTLGAFREGDVYIDYPYEDVKFRFEKETNRNYRRGYGDSEEMEIPYDSDLYNESHSGGLAIPREGYFRD